MTIYDEQIRYNERIRYNIARVCGIDEENIEDIYPELADNPAVVREIMVTAGSLIFQDLANGAAEQFRDMAYGVVMDNR